jgi:hypothetical protein
MKQIRKIISDNDKCYKEQVVGYCKGKWAWCSQGKPFWKTTFELLTHLNISGHSQINRLVQVMVFSFFHLILRFSGSLTVPQNSSI